MKQKSRSYFSECQQLQSSIIIMLQKIFVMERDVLTSHMYRRYYLSKNNPNVRLQQWNCTLIIILNLIQKVRKK